MLEPPLLRLQSSSCLQQQATELRTGDLTMAASVHSFHIIPLDSSEVARPGGIWHGTRNSCNGDKRAVRTRSSISIQSPQLLFVLRAVVYCTAVVPLGFYTPDNNSTLFPNVTTKNVCKHCLMSYGETTLSHSSNTVASYLNRFHSSQYTLDKS